MKGILANTTVLGKVEGKRSQGRLARHWLGNVKEWTGLSLNVLICESEDRVSRR